MIKMLPYWRAEPYLFVGGLFIHHILMTAGDIKIQHTLAKSDIVNFVRVNTLQLLVQVLKAKTVALPPSFGQMPHGTILRPNGHYHSMLLRI